MAIAMSAPLTAFGGGDGQRPSPPSIPAPGATRGEGATPATRPAHSADEVTKNIREFVLFSYAHLAGDMADGRGDYLDALFTLLSVEERQKKDMLGVLQKLMIESDRISSFAIKVSTLSQRDASL